MRAIRKPTGSLAIAVLVLFGFYYLLSSTSTLQDPKPLTPNAVAPQTNDLRTNEVLAGDLQANDLPDYVETPFMPKMTNETLKAELGNAAWKLFHTILARYPETPSKQERDTLTQYIYLFAKVYPCGDCARHFNKLLKKFPPQTASRSIAAVWGCHLHNQVNERLGHPIYDCSHIIEDYDCGCGEDEQSELIDQEHLQFDLQKENKQLG